MISSKERLYGIDLLKFIAALGIALHHFYQVTGYESLEFLGNGGYLVELFFMISGYLAMNSYEKTRRLSFNEYFSNKASRIYPISIIAVLAMVIIEMTFFIMTGSFWGQWGMQEISYWRIIVNCLLLFGGGPVGNVEMGIVNPLWYLCVLFVCELLFWLFVKVANRKKVSVNYFFVLMIVVGLCLYTYSGVQSGIGQMDIINIYPAKIPFINTSMARGYATFFLGCVLFEFHRSMEKKVLWICSFIGIFMFMFPYISGYEFLIDGINYSLVVLLYPSLIFIFSKGKVINKICCNSFVTFLGAVSFEMYVWHVHIYTVQGMAETCGYNTSDRLNMLIYVILTIMISTIMYLFVEKRVNRFTNNRLNIFFEKLLER